jgi:hypothetical protein
MNIVFLTKQLLQSLLPDDSFTEFELEAKDDCPIMLSLMGLGQVPIICLLRQLIEA